MNSDIGMNIGSHLPSRITDPSQFYLERYIPDLNKAVRRFPVGRFHQQVDKSLQAFNIESLIGNVGKIEQIRFPDLSLYETP